MHPVNLTAYGSIRLGTACADLINEGVSGVMVAARGEGTEAMPLDEVAGRKKLVPPDHPWAVSAPGWHEPGRLTACIFIWGQSKNCKPSPNSAIFLL